MCSGEAINRADPPQLYEQCLRLIYEKYDAKYETKSSNCKQKIMKLSSISFHVSAHFGKIWENKMLKK